MNAFHAQIATIDQPSGHSKWRFLRLLMGWKHAKLSSVGANLSYGLPDFMHFQLSQEAPATVSSYDHPLFKPCTFLPWHRKYGSKKNPSPPKKSRLFFGIHQSSYESRWLATPKRWRFVRGHDKPRLMGVVPSIFQVVCIYTYIHVPLGILLSDWHPEGPRLPKNCLLHRCRTALRHVLANPKKSKKSTDPCIQTKTTWRCTHDLSFRITDLKNQMSCQKGKYIVLPSWMCAFSKNG